MRSLPSRDTRTGVGIFPFRKPGILHALGQVRHGVVDRVADLIRRDVDGQAHAILAEVLDGRGHCGHSTSLGPSGGAGSRRPRADERGSMREIVGWRSGTTSSSSGSAEWGAPALYHLARRGTARPRARSASTSSTSTAPRTGCTRIIRLAYFEHPDYVPLLRRAYELWRELEAEAGEQLLHITGILEGGDRILDGVLRSCAEHDLEHEVLGGAEVARRFPAFHLPGGPRRRLPAGRWLPRPRALHRRRTSGCARERSRASGTRARARVGRHRERRPHPHRPRDSRGRAASS